MPQDYRIKSANEGQGKNQKTRMKVKLQKRLKHTVQDFLEIEEGITNCNCNKLQVFIQSKFSLSLTHVEINEINGFS